MVSTKEALTVFEAAFFIFWSRVVSAVRRVRLQTILTQTVTLFDVTLSHNTDAVRGEPWAARQPPTARGSRHQAASAVSASTPRQRATRALLSSCQGWKPGRRNCRKSGTVRVSRPLKPNRRQAPRASTSGLRCRLSCFRNAQVYLEV